MTTEIRKIANGYIVTIYTKRYEDNVEVYCEDLTETFVLIREHYDMTEEEEEG